MKTPLRFQASLFAWLIILTLLVAMPALAEQQSLPSVSLSTPASAADRAYLGLKGAPGSAFTIADIDADLLLIMLFSMYCPLCQEKSPAINALYKKLKTVSRPDLKVVMIGIGANNSNFEVNLFRQRHHIQFPLFADRDGKIYSRLEGKATPDFIGYKRDDKQQFTFILRQSGGFVNPDKFFMDVFKKSGLQH